MRLSALGKVGCVLSLLAVAAIPACTCGSPVDDPNSTVPGSCQWNPPLIQTQKTDILFVVDNSNSMREEQDEVANELPAFVEELKRDAGVGQDFRVGLVTTGVYRHIIQGNLTDYREYPDESGKLRPVPLEDGGVDVTAEHFLDDEDPELIPKFRRLVRQGIDGSGQETPFEAARLAVTEPLISKAIAEGGNAGFLRDGARLMIVAVTDEDDCSETERPPEVFVGSDPARDYCTEQSDKLTSVTDYFGVFRSLIDGKGQARPVLWAAIAPVGVGNKDAALVIDSSGAHNVDCPTSRGPGLRHRAMAQLFDPSLKNVDSICKADYRQSLVDIAAIANNTQVLEVSGIPDPRLIRVELTRSNGEVQGCTVANGGIQYQAATDDSSARILFQPACPRSREDQFVALKLFCAQ
jgi:hypothetical protein